MARRRVLFVTYHFPPSSASGSFRLLGFARHLPRAGWDPIVVAPPSLPWEPTDPELGRQVPSEVIVRPVPYPVGAPKVLRAFFPNLIWLPRAWSACKAVMRELRPEVVLTSGPPHWVHLLGLWLRRSWHIPWVADFRDPWVAAGHGPQPGRLHNAYARYSERKIFEEADLIIANAPNATRLLQAALPAHATKVVTLTNGFDPEEFSFEQHAPEASLRLVHAGEIYFGRDPLPLLDALAGWNRETGNRHARLDVIGRSELPVNLVEEIRRRGLEGAVVMMGQLPYREALRAMGRADILVLFDTPGRKIGVPAKLYEYFGTRRPILALAEADGDTAHILRDSGVTYRLAPPRDPQRIQQALAELVTHLSDRPSLENAGSPLERFTRAHLTGALAALLDRVAHGPAAACALGASVKASGTR